MAYRSIKTFQGQQLFHLPLGETAAPELAAALCLVEKDFEVALPALADSLADAVEEFLRWDIREVLLRSLGGDPSAESGNFPHIVWSKPYFQRHVRLLWRTPEGATWEPVPWLEACDLSSIPEPLQADFKRWICWLHWRQQHYSPWRRIRFPIKHGSTGAIILAAWGDGQLQILTPGYNLQGTFDEEVKIHGDSPQLARALVKGLGTGDRFTEVMVVSGTVNGDEIGSVGGWTQKEEAISIWERWFHRRFAVVSSEATVPLPPSPHRIKPGRWMVRSVVALRESCTTQSHNPEVGRIFLVTVGLSWLTKGLKLSFVTLKEKEQEPIEPLWEAAKKRLQEYCSELDGLPRDIAQRHMTKEAFKKIYFEPSAELNCLARLSPREKDKIVLFHSATRLGGLAGTILKEHIHAAWGVTEIQLMEIDGLHYGITDASAIDRFAWKIQEIQKEKASPITLVVAGGFKIESMALAVVGNHLGLPVCYLHEEFDSLIYLPYFPYPGTVAPPIQSNPLLEASTHPTYSLPANAGPKTRRLVQLIRDLPWIEGAEEDPNIPHQVAPNSLEGDPNSPSLILIHLQEVGGPNALGLRITTTARDQVESRIALEELRQRLFIG